MNRSDLTKAIGQDVALCTHWARAPLGTEHARKVTVVGGPFEKAWSHDARAYVLLPNRGKLWLVSWAEEGYSHDGETKERHVDSKELLGLWTDHETARSERREARRKAADAQDAAEAQADAWETSVLDALAVRGIDWRPRLRPGSATVVIPVNVLDLILEALDG